MQHYRGGGSLLDKLVLKCVGWIDFHFSDSRQEFDRYLDISLIEFNKRII